MAICLACCCGLLGLSVDTGLMFRAKQMLQTAADCGALAGAAELSFGGSAAAAKGASALNGMTDGLNGVTVTVNTPPLHGAYTGVANYVEVIVTQSVPTYFMKIFQINSMNVSARSVGGLRPSAACIYTLDATSTDVSLTGNGSLSIPNCGLIVNSTSSNAVTLSGNATLTAQSIAIVGGASSSSPGALSPAPVTGVAPVSDPLAYLSAPSYNSSACLPNPSPSGMVTLGPSTAGGTICYNGLTLSGQAAVTLNPGVYVINGSFSTSGQSSITGNGVTIYLPAPSGQLSLSGGSVVKLTAPTSGPYSGILLYEDRSNTNGMSVSGGAGSVLTGIFYAPKARVTFTGNGGGRYNADLVCYQLTINGNGTIAQYEGSSGTSPLANARMVE